MDTPHASTTPPARLVVGGLPLVGAVAAQGPPPKPGRRSTSRSRASPTTGPVTPGLFPFSRLASRRRPCATRPWVSRVSDARAALEDRLRRRRQRMAEVEQRPSIRTPGRQLQGDDRGAARARVRPAARPALSAKGLELSRNIMRLNETIAEMTKRFEEYGEGLYNLTVMGEPFRRQPWGWQLDGHHLSSTTSCSAIRS